MAENKRSLTHDEGYAEGVRRMAGALVSEDGQVTAEYLRGMWISIERSLGRLREHEVKLRAKAPPRVVTMPSPRRLGINDEHGGWRVHLRVLSARGDLWEELKHQGLWSCYPDAERFGKQMLAAAIFDLSEWTWTAASGSRLTFMHEEPTALPETVPRAMSEESRTAMQQLEARIARFRDPRLAWCLQGCLHKALGFGMQCDETYRSAYVAGYKGTQHGRAFTELALDAAEILRTLDLPAPRFVP